MKPNSIEKLKQAENFMNAAAGLLDSVVSVEWESLAEGDYKTEECIDEMESIKGGLRPSFFLHDLRESSVLYPNNPTGLCYNRVTA